jgi:flagellar L-ring protein precursor FlgH
MPQNSVLRRSRHVATLASLVMAAPAIAQTPPTTPPAAQPPAGQTPAGQTAAGTSAAGAVASATTPARPVRESWTADRRNYVVGDLITVLIDDYTISTALKENLATDTRTRGLSANARLPTSSKNVGLDTRNSADQQQRGSARRENRFQNELSVRVIAIAPNGLLELKGTKNINVDKSGQDIVFTGFVRPQDISSTNMVESNRVADAQLGYLSPGPLGKPKQGIISKVLGAFWP